MKQIRNKPLLWAAAAVLLLTGCSKEEVDNKGGNSASGNMVSVTLPIKLGETETIDEGVVAVTPATGRSVAINSTAEGFTVNFGEGVAAQLPATRTVASSLTNVWVLQFDKDGKNIKTTNTGTLSADAYPTPTLTTGLGYTICIVANGPASGLSTSNPATLTAFESIMLNTAAVTTTDELPMSGKLSGVSVVDLGDGKGKISLENSASSTVMINRIQAEVTLTVDFDVTGYTLTSAQLYNVPVGATYGWNNAATTFPLNTVAANFGYTNTTAAGMTPLTPTSSGSKTTYKWFMGDNRRGEVAGLIAQRDRNSAKAPAYSTFARIMLTNSTTSTKQIYYDVYLGAGTVTNFDLMRNHTYTATAAIKGTAAFQEALIDVDARVSGVGFPVYIYLTDSKADSPFAISPKNMAYSAIWGPGTATGITDIFDGKGNTDKMMALSNATEYKAAQYCRTTLGAAWNLPAQAQLMLMWIYLPAIPAADRSGSTFWSSTEDSSGSNAWYVDFSSGAYKNTYVSDGSFKGGSNGVRCVRDI